MLLSLWLVVILAAASGFAGQDVKERPQILCGCRLADVRGMYCYDFSKIVCNKPVNISKLGGPKYEQKWAGLWQSTLHARAMAEAWPRSERDPGLVDECYFKPCDISELLSYC